MALGTKSDPRGARFELQQIPQLEPGFPRVLAWGDAYKDVHDAFMRGDFGGPGCAQDRLDGPVHGQRVAIVKIRSATGGPFAHPGSVEVVASWSRVGRQKWRQDPKPAELSYGTPPGHRAR
jgi:hypothetical protein